MKNLGWRQVFYSSGSQALEERLGSESAAERQFVWNLGYVDDLVLRDRDTTNNGALDERLYSLPDLRYSVMALADDTGDVVERFAYDAYGSTSVMDSLFVSRSSSNYDWEFLYTGRREDLETGLYYFRARYYSAQLGRFISRDPRGYVDGLNLYRAYFVPGDMDPQGTAITKAQCEAGAAKAMKAYAAMTAELERKGCAVPTPKCGKSDQLKGGDFDETTNSINLYYNHPNFTEVMVPMVIRHELVHALDRCNGVEFDSCDKRICSEIRAYSFCNCADGSPWRGKTLTRKECAVNGTWSSTVAYKGCKKEGLKERIRKLYDKCAIGPDCAKKPLPPDFPTLPIVFPTEQPGPCLGPR